MTKTKNIRTTQGLRDVLFDEIDDLRNGEGDHQRAMTIANLAKQIINTAKAEMEFQRLISRQEAGNAPLGSLQLGSHK